MRCKKEGDYSGLTVLGGYSLHLGKVAAGAGSWLLYLTGRRAALSSLTQGVPLVAHFP